MKLTPIGIISELRAECVVQNMSHKKLALLMGLTQQTVSNKIGSARSALTLAELIQVCDILQVPLSEIVSRAERRYARPTYEAA